MLVKMESECGCFEYLTEDDLQESIDNTIVLALELQLV